MYELMKWEELEFSQSLEQNAQDPSFVGGGDGRREYKREMEWAWLCREIADLNKTYNATA
jgi:hypothetical protein